VKITKNCIFEGYKVAILTNQLNQVRLIAELLDDYNLPFTTLVGSIKSEERKRRIEDYIEGVYDVVLGTVISEGVDIPEIDVVINAEGGRDAKKTVQRMRNLTIREGKKKAIVIEFADLTNKYFSEHTRDRLDTYRKEGEFDIRYIDTLKTI
jgi:superfamily II DNA/RNA helicase